MTEAAALNHERKQYLFLSITAYAKPSKKDGNGSVRS